MTYLYSATTNAFYPEALKQDYINSNSWPDDTLIVDDFIYKEYAQDAVPEGKQRVPNDAGYPSWGDIPAPEPEIILAKNIRLLANLVSVSVTQIIVLQTVIACDKAREGDPDALKSWQDYLCKLRDMTPDDLQQSPAPFPEQPATVL